MKKKEKGLGHFFKPKVDPVLKISPSINFEVMKLNT